MKFRRVRTGSTSALEALEGDNWGPVTKAHRLAHAALITMLEANPPELGDHASCLPFQPRTYRDFMLYEQHYLQAARGHVRTFAPGLSRISKVWEGITRTTFPPFKPPKLWGREPIYYMGNQLRFMPDGADAPWPAYTEVLDYELELGFVLSRAITDASPEEALSAIGGFVVFNDISARDVQRPEMTSGFGPQKSKHFCNTMSSVIVSADEVIDRLEQLHGRVRINGEIVSECSSANMRFTLGECLAHASRGETVLPGEMFASGTWPNGCGLETGRWVRPGDVVQLEIDGVGTVTNRLGAAA